MKLFLPAALTLASLALCGCGTTALSGDPDSGANADASLDGPSADATSDVDAGSADAPIALDSALDSAPNVGDSGIPETSVACGAVRCDSSRTGPIQGCSVAQGQSQCNNAGCFDHGGCDFILECGTKNDCPNGGVCCFGEKFRTYSDCYTACPSGFIQLCATSAECAPGTECNPYPCADISIGICGTPDAGSLPRCN